MQLFGCLPLAPCCGCRRYVAADGFLPVAQPGEGVRWHVQRMRRIGCNLCVAPSRSERLRRKRRHVICMDNVMSEPGMRRLLREQPLENCSRLEPSSVGLVRGIFRRCERQRVEDLRLMIIWIFRRHDCHGIAIGEQPHLLRRGLEVGIQLAHGLEISTFALRLRTHAFTAFGAVPPKLQLSSIFDSRREWITPIAERDAPVCDSARRIRSQDRVKAFYGTAELEGVQQRYGAVDALLRLRAARCGKVYRPQLFAMAMLMVLRRAARNRKYKQYGRNEFHSDHVASPGNRSLPLSSSPSLIAD